MTSLSAVVLVLAVVGGALLQGGVGFGFAILTAPIAALVDPTLVPGPIIVVSVVVASMIAWRDRRALQFADVAWASLGRVPGNLLGAVVVVIAPQRMLTATLAMGVLGAVALSWRHVEFRRTPRSLVVAGIASGMMGTATSVGGPPVALVYADAPARAFRGTLALFFLIGALTSLGTLAAAGELPWRDLQRGLLLALPVVGGIASSTRFAAYMEGRSVRPAVFMLSALSSMTLLVRETGLLA